MILFLVTVANFSALGGCVFCIILLANSAALQGVSQNEQKKTLIHSKIQQSKRKMEMNLAIWDGCEAFLYSF